MNRLTAVLMVFTSSFAIAAAALPLPFFVPSEVTAVIGRPLTPMSYAGVARRTTRRTVAYTAAATNPYY